MSAEAVMTVGKYEKLYDYIEKWVREEFSKELDETQIEQLIEELNNVRKHESVLYCFFKRIIESYDPKLENHEKIVEVILRIINGFEGFLKESESQDNTEFTNHNIMAALWLKEIIDLILYLFMDAERKAINYKFTSFVYPSWPLSECRRFYVNLKDSKKKLDLALKLFAKLFTIDGIECVAPVDDLVSTVKNLLKVTRVYLIYLTDSDDNTTYKNGLENLIRVLEAKFLI